jgi:adenosylcobinamide-GDP ribazoletransferase
MKQSDIGPFGVLALVFVLLAQVAALAQSYGDSWGRGAAAAVVSGIAGRLALTWAARTGVPAARPEGLGAAVAGVVPVGGAVATTLSYGVISAAFGPFFGGRGYVHVVVAVAVALVVAEMLLRHCRRRFGGVTGDVFGGLAETAATTALVVLSLNG